MKQISLFIPLLGTLLLSGCAGTNSDFECDATTSDTCMTMEQANEKAKKLEQSSEAKPVAASLPRLKELPDHVGAGRCGDNAVPQQACGDSTSGAETAGTTPAVYRCPGSENGCSGQFSCAGNTSPSAKNG